MLECCRNFNVNNFIFASSSSVYGGNQKLPFAEKRSSKSSSKYLCSDKKIK